MRAVENRAALAPDALAELERVTARHASLEQVARWGAAHVPPLVIADVITQDEYTHDVVLPFRALWLVYDTT
ncbi:MAG TPA: hypothetical protein VFF06_33635 [Polyangia bacterium]|nr:hypothetical protein [Polyangia bacterium]